MTFASFWDTRVLMARFCFRSCTRSLAIQAQRHWLAPFSRQATTEQTLSCTGIENQSLNPVFTPWLDHEHMCN